jgi:glycosyltransferase involved in cell wall biosynthesis
VRGAAHHVNMQAVESSLEAKSTAEPAPHRIQLPPRKAIVMLGTSPRTRGGIAAVVNTYRAGGLFDDVRIRYVATHVDGTQLAKGWRFVCAVAELAIQLLLGRVAAVHAHVSSSASFWRKSMLLLMCRRVGVPTIFHLHSGGFAEWVAPGSSSAARAWWIRNTLESSDVVLVLTSTWAKWIKEYAPRANVKVLGNPVSVPAVMPPAEQRASFSGPGCVLFLGWIYDFKGCYDLLKSWALFRVQFPGWRLVVGGKGEVDIFLAEAERLGIRQDIDFLGWVTGEDKYRELRRADIFVLPSYREGMPVSVLEAMAWGVPVIATPVGGVPDMMTPDVHGLWVQPGDVTAMCDRLVRLAGSGELRASLAHEARLHVIRYSSVEAVLQPLTRLYDDLIHGDPN